MHLQKGDALGRRPLEMKFTYPDTLGHVVSEYIWLWQSISKTLGVVACLFLHLQEHLQEGGVLLERSMVSQVPYVMQSQNVYG